MTPLSSTASRREVYDLESTSYRPLFGPAVAGLIFGGLSILGLIPWSGFFAIPAAAILISLWAVAKIRKLSDAEAMPWQVLVGMSGALLTVGLGVGVMFPMESLWRYAVLGVMTAMALLAVFSLAMLPVVAQTAVFGERMARIGLTLGLVFAVGGAVNLHLPREMLIQQAIPVGREWLVALSKGDFKQAFITMLAPVMRPPTDLHWDVIERGDRSIRDGVIQLKQSALARNLAKIGAEAKILFDNVEDVSFEGNRVEAQLIFMVVTPEKQFFLVMLRMSADRNPRTGYQEWRIYDHVAPYSRGSSKLIRQMPSHGHDHGEEGHED